MCFCIKIETFVGKQQMQRRCERPSCWESPCRYGPCPPEPDPNDDVDVWDLEEKLRKRYVPKDPTKLYMTDYESMETVGGFMKGREVWSSTKHDGINVHVIRVGRFVYCLTSGGMVLHGVLLANLFDTRAFPDGASVRAELVIECEGYNNYDCWEATMREFIHSRGFTCLLDLGTKRPRFTRMDAKPQWTASGKRGHPRIHLHVFGLATRGNSIPDASIAFMLSDCHENISAVPWTRVSSAKALLERMNYVWEKGLEGLIVRIVDDGLDAEGGSRPVSPNPDHQIVKYAKAKPTFQCDGVVQSIAKKNGKYVPVVKLKGTRFVDPREVHVRLGYTRTWQEQDNVLVYGIPKFFGDREMRHIVGIAEKSRKRVFLSDSQPGTPDRRHKSDSEGPEPCDAPPVTLSHGFCYYCSELVARDSDWGRDGDIYHHMNCHGPPTRGPGGDSQSIT